MNLEWSERMADLCFLDVVAHSTRSVDCETRFPLCTTIPSRLMLYGYFARTVTSAPCVQMDVTVTPS